MKPLDSFLLCICAFALIGCGSLPVVKGKVCYDTPNGTVCLASNGQEVVIDANLSGK